MDAHERGEFEIIFPTIKNLTAMDASTMPTSWSPPQQMQKTVPTVTPRGSCKKASRCGSSCPETPAIEPDAVAGYIADDARQSIGALSIGSSV